MRSTSRRRLEVCRAVSTGVPAVKPAQVHELLNAMTDHVATNAVANSSLGKQPDWVGRFSVLAADVRPVLAGWLGAKK